MNKKSIVILMFLLILVLCVNPVFCAASDWKLVVRVDGTVQSQKFQTAVWDNIWQSRMLRDGDKARTLEDSRAKVRLADNTVITIGENTIVEMSQFKLTEQSRIAKLNLLMGKLRIKVAKFFGKESKFEVTTPTAVLAARGTDFYIDEGSKNEQAGLTSFAIAPNMTVMVFEGNVNANIGGQNFSVPAGQMLTVTGVGIMVNPIPQVSATAAGVAAAGAAGEQPGAQQGRQPGAKVDADLTNASFGAPAPRTGFVEGGVPAHMPQAGTAVPNTGTTTIPGGQPIYNPSSQDTGSLPVTVQ